MKLENSSTLFVLPPLKGASGYKVSKQVQPFALAVPYVHK